MYKVTIHNLKGTVLPSKSYDFRIDRKSPLGNPFFMKGEYERHIVCDKYEEYFNKKALYNQHVKVYLNKILTELKTNKKVRLFCWCAPKRCHAETIKKWLLEEVQNGHT
jgi:hypothetical protein